MSDNESPVPPAEVEAGSPQTPWWKKWWVIAIAAAVVIGLIANAVTGGSEDSEDATVETSEPTEPTEPTEPAEPAATDAPISTDAPAATEAPITSDPPTPTEGNGSLGAAAVTVVFDVNLGEMSEEEFTALCDEVGDDPANWDAIAAEGTTLQQADGSTIVIVGADVGAWHSTACSA